METEDETCRAEQVDSLGDGLVAVVVVHLPISRYSQDAVYGIVHLIGEHSIVHTVDKHSNFSVLFIVAIYQCDRVTDLRATFQTAFFALASNALLRTILLLLLLSEFGRPLH